MLLKSQEIVIKNKDFFKEKIILLYGENQDLINDINQQIVSKFIEEEKISKSFFEEDVIKNPENIINYYLNGSLFDDNKNISIVKHCTDKILEIVNKIKNNINNNFIILNSEILLKNSKLRQFGEYDKLAINEIPCYAGWIFARVLADGSIAPCCRGVKKIMGNINEKSFKDIWFSRNYNEFRAKAKYLPKENPYFRNIGCLKECDNLIHNEQIHEKLYFP